MVNKSTNTDKNTTTTSTLSKEIKVKVEKEKNILEKLIVPVPEQYLEKYVEDGIEFTGYKAQYAINLLNEVFGLGKWYAEFKLNKIENIKGNWLSYGTIKIFLREQLNKPYSDELLGKTIYENTKILADGIGGSYAKRIENSLKGCKTSAFKNACRYLGIGNELYLAGHEDDIIYVKEEAVAEEQDIEIPNEIKDTIDTIDKVKTLEQLDNILPTISKIEGKAVKSLLIKKYNDKKIALSEK